MRRAKFALAGAAAGPRKQPVQGRSKQTVAAILGATFRVLEEVGSQALTTTRVAAVAGVSVGTLYQYYPNRDALIHALLADHIDAVVEAIENAAAACAGLAPGDAVERVVRAFLAAKATRAGAARILQKAFGPGMLDDRPQVKATAARAQHALARLHGGEATGRVHAGAGLACAAIEGMVRAAIDEDPNRLHDPAWIDQVVHVARAAFSPA